MRGRENLELAGRIHGLGGRALRMRVDELLAHFADRSCRSHGSHLLGRHAPQARRRHRAHPSAADPLPRRADHGPGSRGLAELWTEIGRLTREDGLTILLTTHYLDEADRLASQLAIVDRGRVVATGSPEELKAELRGDAIVVELSDGGADSRAVDAIARVPGIGESLVDGRSLRARAERGAAAVPAVLSALEGAGIGVASVTVSRPSLDDVYLRHTGRAFRQTEESFA